jgi:hypothetical protein
VVDKLAKELSRMGITEELLKGVVDSPDEILFDTVTGRYVALELEHNLIVIYERRNEDKFIITAIYSSKPDEVIQRRKRSGRWI